MTKANITQYDKVAANNTDVQDVPLGENLMYPADVNNAFREVMADLAAVNDGTVAFTSPAAGSLNVTTNIVVGGTVDGRDVAADGTKLDGIEAGATADQTAAEIRALVESATDSNVFTDADHSKLNGIEAGATADQSASEIKTAYESNANTNAFTDAEKSKLTGIEAGATADQTAAEILTAIKTVDGGGSGLDADLLDGLQASSFVRSDTSDTMTGNLDINNGASTTLSVRGSGTGMAKIWARGSNQATGMVMVSQDDSYGGGIEYNGDNNPSTTGAGADQIALFRVSVGVYSWTARNSQSSNDWQFRGNVTAYASDKRLKENIEVIPNALDKVCKLRGVTFDWKDDCEEKGFMPTMKHETGVIAQEVQAVIPDAAVPAPFNEEYLTVKHEKIIPVLIEAIKELKAEVEALKSEK